MKIAKLAIYFFILISALTLARQTFAATDFVCKLRSSGGDYTSINSWRAAIACDLTASSTKVFTVSDKGTYSTSDDGSTVTFTGGGTGTLKHINTDNYALIVGCAGTINTGTVTISGSNHTFTISDTGEQIGNAVLSCYNDWANGLDESYIDIKNFTTNADHWIKIWTDPNESGTQGPNRHDGTAESGFYINNSGTSYTFVFRVDYVIVEGLEIQEPSKPAYAVLYNTSNWSNHIYRKLLIHNVGGIIYRGANARIENSIFYDFGSSGYSVVRFGKVYNCSVYAAAGVGSYSGQIIVRDAECYNVLLYNADSGSGYHDYYNCTGDYNVGSDTSAPGANSLDSQTLNDINWVSTATSSEDLHIQSTSCAKDAGTDLSSYFTDDIDGDTRSGTWDIGADEYVSAGALTVDIIDSGGNSVANPSMAMNPVDFSFSYQTATGTLGVSDQKIRVENTTANPQWTLTIAPATTTAFWDSAGTDYDFNDPTANAGDGSDADNLGGQMTIDASGGTLGGTCSATDITKGSSTSFSEGITDSITLLTAGASADTSCYWDLTGVSVSQTIPAEQPAASDYTIDMVLTVTAD